MALDVPPPTGFAYTSFPRLHSLQARGIDDKRQKEETESLYRSVKLTGIARGPNFFGSSSGVARSAEPTLLGTFNDWTAHTYQASDTKV